MVHASSDHAVVCIAGERWEREQNGVNVFVELLLCKPVVQIFCMYFWYLQAQISSMHTHICRVCIGVKPRQDVTA